MYWLKDRINFQHWGLCQFFSFHLPICKKFPSLQIQWMQSPQNPELPLLWPQPIITQLQVHTNIPPKLPVLHVLCFFFSLCFFTDSTHTLRNTHLVFAPSQQREAPGGGDPSQWQRRRAEAVAEQSCVAGSLPFATTLSVIHAGDTQALWGTVWFYSHAFFKSFVKTHQCFRKWTKGNLFLWQPCITGSIHALLL